MRVILTEQEILMAIEDFILDTVKVPDDVRVDIDLKATRGEQGYTAEIDLLQMDEPEGSRAVDDRVEPTEDARAEGLDIVGKIDAARAEAKAPRRRGRPAGSKNLPKPDVTPASTSTATTASTDAIEAHPAHETAETTQVEASADTQVEPEPETPAPEMIADAVDQNEAEAQAETEVQANTVDTPEVVDAPAETGTVVADQPVEAPVETAVETPAADAPATDASTQTKAKRSLFDNMTTAGDPEPEPEPEPNSEAALAAEAAATEPAVEAEDEPEVDYTPTPETTGLTSDDATATEDAPAPAPTRSLFANLTKPTN